MSTETKKDELATEGCAAVPGYVVALENALYAAIVCLYSTHKEDCVNTFTFDELSAVVDRTRSMPAGTKLEDIYAKALRHPHTDQGI